MMTTKELSEIGVARIVMQSEKSMLDECREKNLWLVNENLKLKKELAALRGESPNNQAQRPGDQNAMRDMMSLTVFDTV